MMKKIFAAGITLVVFGMIVSGVAFKAQANDSNENSNNNSNNDINAHSVFVTKAGKVEMTGAEVVQVNSATAQDADGIARPTDMTFKVWGLTFKVLLDSKTKVQPEKASDLLVVGHIVNLNGDIDANGVIHAKTVKDLNMNDSKSIALKAAINELIKKLNELLVKQGKPTIPAVL